MEYKSFNTYKKSKRNRYAQKHVQHKQKRKYNNLHGKHAKCYNLTIMKQLPKMIYPDQRMQSQWRRPINRFTFLHARVDLTHLDVYTIDPAGCDDIDDGFSIETMSGSRTLLHIHICDPTSEFNPWDQTFNCAITNGTSLYPSGRSSLHMFNRDFAKKCSLKEGIKMALTMTYVFKGKLLCDVMCRMSTIFCSPRFHYSYLNAGYALKKQHSVFMCATQLSASLKAHLDGEICYGNLTHFYMSYPKTINKNDRIRLIVDNEHKIHIKKMIAIFSVSTNGMIAKFLIQVHKKFNPPDENVLTKKDACLVTKFVSNRVMPYTHFTSPLRRICDCVIHFEVKNLISECNGYVFSRETINKLKCRPTPVFDTSEIVLLSKASLKTQKQYKTLQRANIKFRFLQYIHQRLTSDGSRRVILGIQLYKQTPTMASIFINSIDGHKTHFMYYVYDAKGIQSTDECIMLVNSKNDYIVHISHCNVSSNKYHNNVLPQIDKMFGVQSSIPVTGKEECDTNTLKELLQLKK